MSNYDNQKKLLADLPEEVANTLETLFGSVGPATALPITPERDRMYLRAAEMECSGESERYLRDLLGDDEFEYWNND